MACGSTISDIFVEKVKEAFHKNQEFNNIGFDGKNTEFFLVFLASSVLMYCNFCPRSLYHNL